VAAEYMQFRKVARFAEIQNNSTVTQQTEDVLSWWSSIATDFPKLRIVAAKLFSIRVSSVSAERLFSLAGLMRIALRNRMSAVTFDALIAYSYNSTTLRKERNDKAEKRLS